MAAINLKLRSYLRIRWTIFNFVMFYTCIHCAFYFSFTKLGRRILLMSGTSRFCNNTICEAVRLFEVTIVPHASLWLTGLLHNRSLLVTTVRSCQTRVSRFLPSRWKYPYYSRPSIYRIAAGLLYHHTCQRGSIHKHPPSICQRAEGYATEILDKIHMW